MRSFLGVVVLQDQRLRAKKGEAAFQAGAWEKRAVTTLKTQGAASVSSRV